MKTAERWFSPRMHADISLVRWGHYGTPVLLFPTAGGDAEEAERNSLLAACTDLVDGGRVKIYSCDSVAGQAMVAKVGSPAYRLWLLNRFHECVRYEIVPAIHADQGGPQLVIAAGASIGAFNSVAVMCRYPDVFRAAIGMSGTYEIGRFYEGEYTDDLYVSSPVDFLPGLEGPHLDLLRQRFAILASGQGAWEDVGSSWRTGTVLGSKGIPNRVDAWGPEWPHEWHTWHAMLPQYLDELT